MTLHPQARTVLDFIEAEGGRGFEEVSVAEARESFRKMSLQMNHQEQVASVSDYVMEGDKKEITLRVYKPVTTDNLPVLVYYHGGGWVIGDLDTHDALCRSLANESGCAVVSVDYSLAPEYKFPTAVEDAYLSVKWVFENAGKIGIDPEKIAVGGDSAGGNLAAVVCHLAKQRRMPEILFQLLIYPSTGFELTRSYEQFGEGYFLTKGTMKWFREQYLNGAEDTKNPLAAPMLIEDVSDLPPAMVITAEYDPLVDGGAAYAEKLKNAGVETKYACYEGMIHGFVSMAAVLDDGKRAISDMAAELKNVFSSVPN